ncbi:MAG: septum formation initiator family protein [Catonella sp.]|jgi:cell division protein FtsB|nr:septum formation initiator family protein [Catonella sp.]MDY6356480.1 septum formation initiator family protein [Catonella sp.]
MRGRKGRKRYMSRLGLFLCFAVVCVMCVFINYKKIVLTGKMEKLVKKQQSVEREIASENARKEELEKLAVDVNTKKFIEDTAREKFGLVYKDEIIFEPSDDN